MYALRISSDRDDDFIVNPKFNVTAQYNVYTLIDGDRKKEVKFIIYNYFFMLENANSFDTLQ